MKPGLRLAVWAGGCALLAATLVDTMAVIGRNAGFPLTGSIELMQAVILASGAISLVIATHEGTHARVRLLLDRASPPLKAWLEWLSDGITLLFVAALLAGSGWLAWELWGAHEESEVIGLPWRVLRLAANLALLATALILVLRLITGRRPQ